MNFLAKSMIAAMAVGAVAPAAAKNVSLQSPSGLISVEITDEIGPTICYNVTCKDIPLLKNSQLAIFDTPQRTDVKIKRAAKPRAMSETIDAPFYRQRSFSTSCNSVTLELSNGFGLEFRAYDEGVAYRFVSKRKGQTVIYDELASFAFPGDQPAWLPYSTNDEKPFAMAYQNYYDATTLSHAKDKYAFLPLTVGYDHGVKLTIAESDLEAYPGMMAKVDTTALTINAAFAPYPKDYAKYPWRQQSYVTATEQYIARAVAPRAFPWRVMAITTDDKQMPVNNLVYALASPSRIADTSWIKPGKVAWDWWNDWGLKGVPFKAGINMPTYKYYIDFAAAHKIEYVVLDEGWYDPKSGDMLTVIKDLDLAALVQYAADKGVGIVLWTVFNVLDDQLQAACEKYSQLGIKGFKVDFLDRDDQQGVEMAYRIADACAQHKLLLDYHGIYKPTGINRTYPNILNFESVFGMEEMKWSTPDVDMPMYDVTFPYIRLLAGYVDYTPGAMRNASKADWHAVYYNPESQGTRCHQLATYVVYDSPFTMLCDAPTNYANEDICLDFIVGVPNQIDRTVVVGGEMGKYIVTARQAGNDWWVGALTNWDARDIPLDFSFIDDGEYRATFLVDGPNADKQAQDFDVQTMIVTPSTKLMLHMASGGGAAIKLSRK